MKTKLILFNFLLYSVLSAYSQIAEVIYTEEFDDAAKIALDWPNNELTEGLAHIWVADGKYGIENVKDQVYLAHELDPITKIDAVEFGSVVSYVSGDKESLFGIFITDANGVNYIGAINANGYSAITTSTSNDDEVSQSGIVKPGENSNGIVLRVTNDRFSLYVNGEHQNTIRKEIKLPITHAGFIVKGERVIRADNFRITKFTYLPKAHSGIYFVGLANEGKQIVSKYSSEFFVWNSETGERIDSLELDAFSIAVFFTEDLKYYLHKDEVYGKKANFVAVKEVKTNKEVYTLMFKDKCSRPFVIDNKTVVVQDYKNNAINYYDLTSGALQKSLKLVEKELELNLVVDLQHAYFRFNDVMKYIDLEKGTTLYELPIYNAFVSNNKQMLFTCKDSVLVSYEVATGKPIKSLTFNFVSKYGGVEPEYADDKLLIATYYQYILVIDLESFTLLKKYEFNESINNLAIDPELQYVYAGLDNGELRKVNLATGETELMFGKIKD